MASPSPRMVPALMIRRGHVVTPGPSGPIVLDDASGRPVDVLDLSDGLLSAHGRLYVIDLDGIDRDAPQLDYLQEMSRGGELWVDAGVKNADQAIDVLVAGATRAVLSSSALQSPDELGRAWALSTDLVFEVDTSTTRPDGLIPDWEASPGAVAARARSLGPREIVYRFRDAPPQWGPFAEVASIGPTWAAGPILASDLAAISAAQGAGGIFTYDPEPIPDVPPVAEPIPRAQDDEN
jgi:hypothetical protein